MNIFSTKWQQAAGKVAAIGASLILLLSAISLVVPAPASAAIFGLERPNLIVCGGDIAGENDHECTFNDLFKLAQAIISFIFYLSVPAAIILFSYAGWLYMSAGDDSGKVEKAKGIFLQVLIGFLLICAAWLIVYTVVDALLDQTEYNIIDGQSIKLGN